MILRHTTLETLMLMLGGGLLRVFVFLSGTSPRTIRGYGYKKESGKANKVDNGMRKMSHKSRCSEITRVNGSLSWALPKAGEGGGL